MTAFEGHDPAAAVFRGRVTYREVNLAGDDGYDPDASDHRAEAPLGEANLVSSYAADSFASAMDWHMPVIDVDLPMRWEPSTNEGHGHLYVDVPMPWEHVVKLLDVLVEIGLVERGYAAASIERGATFVRLPWVKKGAAAPDAHADAHERPSGEI